MNKINFKLSGLACSACVKLVTNRFNKIDGVKEVDINVLSGDTAVSSDKDISLDVFQKALEETPYSIVK